MRKNYINDKIVLNKIWGDSYMKNDLTNEEIEVLQKYLTPEFASVVVGSLNSSHITLSSIVVLCMSLFVVSRGINQLYGWSKSRFGKNNKK